MRRANKACKKGQLRIRRKGYKRKDGTRVKGTTFCAEDRGAPGRGKKILPPIKEGGLGGPGYLEKSSNERHAELDRCVKKDGYRTCLGRVMWLERMGKRTFTKEQKQKLRGDRDYVVHTYGGEGTFGPRKKRGKRQNPGDSPRTNPEVAAAKRRCMR
jgi:hypothetical protein